METRLAIGSSGFWFGTIVIVIGVEVVIRLKWTSWAVKEDVCIGLNRVNSTECLYLSAYFGRCVCVCARLLFSYNQMKRMINRCVGVSKIFAIELAFEWRHRIRPEGNGILFTSRLFMKKLSLPFIEIPSRCIPQARSDHSVQWLWIVINCCQISIQHFNLSSHLKIQVSGLIRLNINPAKHTSWQH